MKRKTLVKIHVIASGVAVLTISTFFVASLIAEIRGDADLIRTVKQAILYGLPVMIVAMPALGITGSAMAGQSKHPTIVQKQRRMKFVMINGMILISLAVFLFFQSHYRAIDGIFLTAQIMEFVFGLLNLTLIGLNIKAGLVLSGRMKPKKDSK